MRSKLIQSNVSFHSSFISDNHFIGRFRAAAKFETVNMCHVQALLVDNFTFYKLFLLFTRISDDLSI